MSRHFKNFHAISLAFVSRNFISGGLSVNLVHIYRFLEKNEHFDCETLLRVIETQTKQVSEVDRFIELCLFDALIGNHDRHGRNLGLIQTPNGTRLSPFYDNPSYLAMEDDWLLGAHHEPRGKIFTAHSQEPTLKDYVREWKRLGFRKNVEEFLHKISLERIQKIIQNGFVSQKRKQALDSLISRRYKELINELS